MRLWNDLCAILANYACLMGFMSFSAGLCVSPFDSIKKKKVRDLLFIPLERGLF